MSTLEAEVLAPHAVLVEGLAAAGLNAERRSLRVIPAGFVVAEGGQGVWRLDFSLPRGCFATSVVQELAALAAEN